MSRGFLQQKAFAQYEKKTSNILISDFDHAVSLSVLNF